MRPAPQAGLELSSRALNRSVLARQHLLHRSDGDIASVLEGMGGLQAQAATAMYIGLWSRMARFQREDLTRALERREVVQGTLLRATIHLVSAADYWPLALAVRDARRAWLLRVDRSADGTDLAQAAARLRAALRARGTMKRAEVEAVVGRPRMNAIGLWLDMVRVPPSGTWERRRADLYALAEDWLGPAPEAAPAAAVAHLVRRYLTGFGPAPVADIARWGGLPNSLISAAADQLSLARLPGGLVDLPGAPRPAASTRAPVRFLGTWDAALLTHARRTEILPEPFRQRIFHVRMPQSVNTFLVDGQVAGSWKVDAGEVKLDPFADLSSATLRLVHTEGDRMLRLFA